MPLLLEKGHEVTGLDAAHFEGLDFVPRTSFPNHQLKKDIRDVMENDFAGIDAVFHFAALSDAPQEALGKELMRSINIDATINLAKLAKKAGVKRFLFASSCSVYGKADNDELVTEQSPLHPVSLYAVSKIEAEQGLEKLADQNFFPIFLRNATCYGISPRMRFDLVVNNLLGYAISKGEVAILSDGTPWRPIVHIEDVAQAFLLAFEAKETLVKNQKFNVGSSDENYQIREIAEIIASIVPRVQVNIANTRGTDPRSYRVNFEKLKSLGFAPKWNLRKFLKSAVQIFSQRGFTEQDFFKTAHHTVEHYQSLIKAKKIDSTLKTLC